MVSNTGIAGPTRIPLPVVTSDMDPSLRRVVEGIRDVLSNHEARLAAQEVEEKSLEDLFRESGASSTDNVIEASEQVPPVSSLSVRTLPDRIIFLFPPPPFIVNADGVPVRGLARLWRGLEDDNAQTLDAVAETSLQQLTDSPPTDIAYRYYVQYRSTDGLKTGPLTPPEGVLFKATAANPETVLAPNNGGLFLETFEDANIGLNWQDYSSSTATIDYPENGVVGGKVARIAGDMWWGLAKQLIPYDPNVIYRVKVGLRRTVAATGGVAGQDHFYAGIAGVAADGVTLINASGANLESSQFYVAADGDIATLNTYTEFTGYFKGLSAAPSSVAANDLDAPAPLYTGVKYFRPLLIANYNNGNGTVEIDYIRIDALQPTPPWICRGNCVAQDSSIMKSGGAAAWDSDASSLNSFTTCYVRAKFSDVTSHVMFALNSDPLTDLSYVSLDYALYGAAGTLHIYESSVDIGAFGTYTVNDEFAIVRDLAAGTVTYYKNRVQLLQRTGLSTATRYYADTSFFTAEAVLNYVDFGPGIIIPTIDTGQTEPNLATDIDFVVDVGPVHIATFATTLLQIDPTPFPYDCHAIITATCQADHPINTLGGIQLFYGFVSLGTIADQSEGMNFNFLDTTEIFINRWNVDFSAGDEVFIIMRGIIASGSADITSMRLTLEFIKR